jgi:D-alanyl-lipoteichoic acid acyltransferase DltB (MBOAT superfamily)
MADASMVERRGAETRVSEDEESAGRPATSISLRDFLVLSIQLGLVLATAFFYRLELERGFGVVGAVMFLGFLVHAWMPARARLPFFLFLTMSAIGILLRADGLWLVAMGLGLVGLCHLPVAWAGRVALVLAAAAVLAAMRSGWMNVSWAGVVIPILASMFMFRLIIYLYDLKNDRTSTSLWQRLSYFFLLPNICFPLFPVIDYKTFNRTYYDAPATEIYQKGVYWMLRGIVHLVLYRLIYYLLPRVDSDLCVIVGVFAFMAMTYGLYLRVSGLFHLIVGSLCLFGFNLPRTNNHYFLASSFNDLWRRINIYWKDFMMKVVFYPVFVAARRWEMSARLVVATGAVFFVTWFLHSYQWFWLQGVFPVAGTDIAFWGFLGIALAANSIWEARHRRRSRLGQIEWSWKEAASVTARTIGVFSVMALIWSLWDSGSFAEWGYRLEQVGESDGSDWSLFIALMTGIFLVGILAHGLNARGWGLARLEQFSRERASTVVPSVSMVMLMVLLPFGNGEIGTPLGLVVDRARSTELNRMDREQEERGYYETLTRGTQTRVGVAQPAGPEDLIGFSSSPAVRQIEDVRGYEIIPGVQITFRGSSFRANSWGLHDREYHRAKPGETYRVALLGSSYVMGWRVSADQTFENLVEDRLNREFVDRGYQKYEILNFAVGGYNVLQSLYVAQRVVPQFEPDAVFYVVHPNESNRLIERLHLVLQLGVRLDEGYQPVIRILEQAKTSAGHPLRKFRRRLEPYRDDILRWAYGEMATSVQRSGARPVFVFMPTTDQDFDRTELLKLTNFAHETGAVVLHISNVFAGHDRDRVQIEEGDGHPSPFGHQLIADALYQEILANSVVIGLSRDMVERDELDDRSRVRGY